MTTTVSVTCPNCGNPVMIKLENNTSSGFCKCCYSCGANVSGMYSWSGDDDPIIQYVRAGGGFNPHR